MICVYRHNWLTEIPSSEISLIIRYGVSHVELSWKRTTPWDYLILFLPAFSFFGYFCSSQCYFSLHVTNFIPVLRHWYWSQVNRHWMKHVYREGIHCWPEKPWKALATKGKPAHHLHARPGWLAEMCFLLLSRLNRLCSTCLIDVGSLASILRISLHVWEMRLLLQTRKQI